MNPVHIRKIGKIAGLLVILAAHCTAASAQLSPGFIKTLDRLVAGANSFSSSFTGFALQDPQSGILLYDYQSDHHFIPCSNVKLFTFFAARQLLGDSIPALRYAVRGDHLYLQGTGNPLLLHPELPQDEDLLHFLQRPWKSITFFRNNMMAERYALGWSWDDFSYYYQTERSAMPLYGNVMWLHSKSDGVGFDIMPGSMMPYLRFNKQLNEERGIEIKRAETSNAILFNAQAEQTPGLEFEIPFYQAHNITHRLLGDTLGQVVRSLLDPGDQELDWKTWRSPLPDTLYRRLLQDSDNFLAEQLLLSCSAVAFDGDLDDRRLINFVLDSLLSDIPDRPRWVDGSGLSRYNLFTPRANVYLLQKMIRSMDPDRLLPLLAVGGKSGTLQRSYRSSSGPYVFAKTGSLSNNHCLSGYLRTRSGRILAFSFMHNHFRGSSRPIKAQMEEVLVYIRDNY